MKKILIILLFSFLFSQNIIGQTVFQKSIGFTFDTTFIRCLPDGKAVFLVGKTNINGQLKVHFLKVNRDGNLLWHKEFPLNDYNYDIKAISLQSDGILAIISGKWDAFLMKLNQETGALVWNKHFGEDENLQLYDVVCDDKDNIWLSGLHKIAPLKMDSTYYFQIKLTKNAVPIATKSSVFQTITPYQNFTQYYKPSNMVWHTVSQSLISVKDIGAEFTHGFTVGLNGRRFELMVPDSTMKYKEFYSGQNGNYIDFTSTKKYLIFSAQDIDTASKYSFGILKPDVSGHVKIHISDGEMQPIHSNGNTLIFYSKKYKSLTRYDEELNPIWTKKYDYCLNTGVFCADIAEDGSIFTVRNVANTTVLSRLNGDGEMPNCIAYNVKSVPESNFRFIAVGFSTTIHGDYKLPIIKDSLAELRDNSGELSPFCLKNNAIFQIPDTVCMNTSFQATRVDTMTGLKHMWAFKPNYAEIGNPAFSFNSTGLKSIFHKVAINFCEDSLSQNVFVIPEPIIPLNDTILCGQKDLTIDLTAKYANAYLLNNKPINPIKTIDSSGIYTFKITTKGCVIEKKINIKINNFTIPEIKQIGVPCDNEAYPIVFDKRFNTIIWDNKLINSDTIFVNNNALHNYSANYKLDSNCVIKGSAQITRRTCTDIFIPTAFSPNNDQINDAFEAFPQAKFKIISLSIFDRWGELLFKSTDTNTAWDGTFKSQNCTEGIYIYVVKYLNINTLKEEVISGDVTLMR